MGLPAQGCIPRLDAPHAAADRMEMPDPKMKGMHPCDQVPKT